MKYCIYVPMLFICIFFISGCTFAKKQTTPTQTVNNNAYAQINETDIWNLSSQADVNFNYTDAETLFQNAHQVVIATIDTIAGGSNFNEQTGEYIFPYTYGKMTILKVLKGSLAVNQQIDYIRMGGIISYDDYCKGLLPAEKQKLNQNIKNKPKYVKRMFGEDIDIEPGKTYLIYIDEGDSQAFPTAKKGAYPIIGWESGLREIKGDIKDLNQLRVFNHITKKWEPITDIIVAP